jgi:hypothetical protein
MEVRFMYAYKCPACEKEQYSSSRLKSEEKCIYCGNPNTELVGIALGNSRAVIRSTHTSSEQQSGEQK